MSIHTTMTAKLEQYKSLDLDELPKKDIALMRKTLIAGKQAVEGCFNKTKADIETLQGAIESEQIHLAGTTRLIRPAPALLKEYQMQMEDHKSQKAQLEQRLISQGNLLVRIDTCLGKLPGQSCCSTLFSKQNAVVAVTLLAGLAGFFTRHFIKI